VTARLNGAVVYVGMDSVTGDNNGLGTWISVTDPVRFDELEIVRVGSIRAWAIDNLTYVAATPLAFYVATCGDDSWSGLTDVCAAPDGPKATIQAAINASLDGDDVVLLTGTYNENIDLSARRSRSVASIRTTRMSQIETRPTSVTVNSPPTTPSRSSRCADHRATKPDRFRIAYHNLE